MDWRKLEKLIPVAAGIANPALGSAAEVILTAVDNHLAAQAAASGQTRDQIIADAAAKWQANLTDAEALRQEGHT